MFYMYFIHKNECHVFSVKRNSLISPTTWLLINLACHMGSRSQWKVAAIMTSSIMTSSILPSPRWQIYETLHENTPDFRHQYTMYTFSGLIFQKPFIFVRFHSRNNIILHVYSNLRCNENWWKVAYHASSVQRVVSYAPCVLCDVRLPNFAPFLPGTGDFKIFVQNKIFSPTTDQTFWVICKWNQTVIFVLP